MTDQPITRATREAGRAEQAPAGRSDESLGTASPPSALGSARHRTEGTVEGSKGVPMLPDPLGGRSLPEWIGATPDTKIPPRVRDRVFQRAKGVCHLSKRKIMPGEAWDVEHVRSLKNGGENRETNLAPALRDKHREKTADDVAEKSKTYRMRAKHTGTWPEPVRKLQSRGFPPSRKQRSAQR